MSINAGNQEASQGPVEEKTQGQVIDQSEERQSGSDDLQSQTETSDEKQPDVSSLLEQVQLKLKESEEKREEAEKQVSDFADRFRKAQAQLKVETEEQRARMQRTFDQKLEAARGDILAGLLDTLDNLKRAIAAIEKSEKRQPDFDSLLEGVRATANLFESKMLSMGLTPVASVGEVFNPEVHEAVEIVAVSQEQDNRVIEEFQTGYKFGDRLLRPARVRVGKRA